MFGQKTYNGVAILARDGVRVGDVATGMRGFDDEQKRVIAATVDGVRVVCAYVPNGQSVGSDKYEYKLRWCAAAEAYLRDALAQLPRPRVRRRHQHRSRSRATCTIRPRGRVRCCSPSPSAPHSRAGSRSGSTTASGCSSSRRRRYFVVGLPDARVPEELGLRIDHVLVTPSLAARCVSCTIDRNARKGEKPSDHAPVIADFAEN